jgi:hypothetical protein
VIFFRRRANSANTVTVKRLGPVLSSLLLGVALIGCGRVSILDDFRKPYEQEGILLPQSSRSFVLAGPPGVMVDIGIDFDDNESRTDRLRLLVDENTGARRGAMVPGSQMQQAVCGVRLSPGGVQVEVQNLNAMRSAPYSLRIERSPSLLCQPRKVIPNTATVRRTLPGSSLGSSRG